MTGRSMVAMSWQVLLRLSHDGSIAAVARGNGYRPCLDARNGGQATASSEGPIRHRSRRRSWSPTHVGGGEPRRGVPSRREAALVARAQARSGHADPAHDDWSGDRTRPQTWHVAGGALDALVCRTGDRDHGAPALRAAAISVRGTDRVLAARRGAVVWRRTTNPVPDHRHGPWDGRLVPARKPARRIAGVGGPGGRARRCGDHRLQQTRTFHQRADLHPTAVRDRLARRVCASGAVPAGWSRRGTGGPSRKGKGWRPA